MSIFDCGRCGARFPDEGQLDVHRRESHGGAGPRVANGGVPMGAKEKSLNGHTRAEEIRRKSPKG